MELEMGPKVPMPHSVQGTSVCIVLVPSRHLWEENISCYVCLRMHVFSTSWMNRYTLLGLCFVVIHSVIIMCILGHYQVYITAKLLLSIVVYNTR
jgi:hypothetical protein